MVGRGLKLPPATSGALMLCGGLANTSFVGLPMILAFYAPDQLQVGLLMDPLGTYLVLNTLGLAVASLHMPGPDRDATPRRVVGRTLRLLMTFPPFIALIAELCLLCVGLQVGASIVALQHGLDARVITAMVGLGILLSFVTLPGWWAVLSWAAG